MSSLVEALYPLPDFRRTPLSALGWWESRRLQYNLIVGSAGLVTLTCFTLYALTFPGAVLPTLQGLVIGSLAYGIAANVCYTLGWWAEMLARLVWGRTAPQMGPLLYRQGVIFSVGLTLLPILMLTAVALARLGEAILF